MGGPVPLAREEDDIRGEHEPEEEGEDSGGQDKLGPPRSGHALRVVEEYAPRDHVEQGAHASVSHFLRDLNGNVGDWRYNIQKPLQWLQRVQGLS